MPVLVTSPSSPGALDRESVLKASYKPANVFGEPNFPFSPDKLQYPMSTITNSHAELPTTGIPDSKISTFDLIRRMMNENRFRKKLRKGTVKNNENALQVNLRNTGSDTSVTSASAVDIELSRSNPMTPTDSLVTTPSDDSKSEKPLFLSTDDDESDRPPRSLASTNFPFSFMSPRPDTAEPGEVLPQVTKQHVAKVEVDEKLALRRFVDKAIQSGIEVKKENGEYPFQDQRPIRPKLRPGINFTAQFQTAPQVHAAPRISVKSEPQVEFPLSGNDQDRRVLAEPALPRPLFSVSAVELVPPRVELATVTGYPYPHGSPPPAPAGSPPLKPASQPPFDKPPPSRPITTAASTIYIASPNGTMPSQQTITFAPRTIVSPPPRRARRANKAPQTPKQPPTMPRRGSYRQSPPRYSPSDKNRNRRRTQQSWTNELNERERDMLAHGTHLLSAQRDFDYRRHQWDRFRAHDAEALRRLRADLDASRRIIESDQRLLREDKESTRIATEKANEMIMEAADQVSKQLQSLAAYSENLAEIYEGSGLSYPTSAHALGGIIRQFTFIIERQAIDSSALDAFILHRIVSPAIRFLIFSFKSHGYLDTISAIRPPDDDIRRLARVVQHLRSQLSNEQVASAPGIACDFETRVLVTRNAFSPPPTDSSRESSPSSEPDSLSKPTRTLSDASMKSNAPSRNSGEFV